MVIFKKEYTKTVFVRHSAISIPQADPFGRQTFWEKPGSGIPIKLDKWRTELKLALPAKESITLDTLLGPQPKRAEVPLAKSERERRAKNAQLKMKWENRCQEQMKIGIICGDKTENENDQKTV